MLSVKQGSIEYHFLRLWYDLTWDWAQVFCTFGDHSNHYTNESIYIYIYIYVKNMQPIKKPSLNDDNGVRHVFRIEASLPLTLNTPLVPNDTHSMKRTFQKQDLNSHPDIFEAELVRNVCFSKVSLASHMRFHDRLGLQKSLSKAKLINEQGTI